MISSTDRRGYVIWLTGLSAAGKSTIAEALEAELDRRGASTYRLDGDVMRTGLCADLGFSQAARSENIRRVGHVANILRDAGKVCIVACISPFKGDRRMVRGFVPEGRFIEVFVNAPLSVCEQRDPKKLYQRARRGEIPDFSGIGSPYEPPEAPEIEVHTDHQSVAQCVGQIIDSLQSRGLL